MKKRAPKPNNKSSQQQMLKNLTRALDFLDGQARTRQALADHLGVTPLTTLRYLDAWLSLKLVGYENRQRPAPFTYVALVRFAPALKMRKPSA